MTDLRGAGRRAVAGGAARGFTIIEMLVVTAISIILLTIGFEVYKDCLQIYREAQGRTAVFETSKLISRDFRDYLSRIIPVRGSWINPKYKQFGALTDDTLGLDTYYLNSSDAVGKQNAMANNKTYDYLFSLPQWDQLSTSATSGLGYHRTGGDDMTQWYATPTTYPGLCGWWMPAFFGKRTSANLADSDIMAGSWGWPRPDYRLSADADNINNNSLLSCWFYAEDREFISPYTLALDNANIVLVSIKFSKTDVAGREDTQLCFLRHHIVGFDVPSQSLVKADHTFGSMLRSITMTPYYLNSSNVLTAMDDAQLGCDKTGLVTAGATDGMEVPRCFDVKYELQNPGNRQRHKFALRVYCEINAKQ